MFGFSGFIVKSAFAIWYWDDFMIIAFRLHNILIQNDQSKYIVSDYVLSPIGVVCNHNSFFVHSSNFFFFIFFFCEKPRNFMFIMRFGPRRSFYEKKSLPASCGQNLNVKKFQFQIISKPFDRSTLCLIRW